MGEATSPTPHTDALSTFRWMYCLALAVIALGELSKVAVRYGPLSSVYSPTPLFQLLFGNHPIAQRTAQILGVLLVLTLVLAAFGIFTRMALAASLVLFLVFIGTMMGWCKPVSNLPGTSSYHDVHAFALAILLIAPGVDRWRLQLAQTWPPRFRWAGGKASGVGVPLVAVRAVLSIAYFGSAYSKLQDIGWKWADGFNLQTILLQKYDIFPNLSLGRWLAQHHQLCLILSVATLVLELGFWTVLLWPRRHWVRWLYVLAGLTFHIATWALMGIYQFLFSMCAVYLVFIEWPTLRQQISSVLKRHPLAQAEPESVGLVRRPWAVIAGCGVVLCLQLFGVLSRAKTWPLSDYEIFDLYGDYRDLVEVTRCEVTLPKGGTHACFGAVAALGRPVAMRLEDFDTVEDAGISWANERLRHTSPVALARGYPGRLMRVTLRHFPVIGGTVEVRRVTVEVPF